MSEESTTLPPDDRPEGFEALRPFFEAAEVPAPKKRGKRA